MQSIKGPDFTLSKAVEKLGHFVVGVRNKLRRLSAVGYHGYTLSTRSHLYVNAHDSE